MRRDREIIPTRLKKLVKSNQENEISMHGVLRAHTLYTNAIRASQKGLDAVEVGVFRGGTAKIILEGLLQVRKSKSKAYFIDTFAGHPANAVNLNIDGKQRVGHFSETNMLEVNVFLEKYAPKFELVQENALNLSKKSLASLKRIGICHIDVDLYLPTLHVLNIFHSRMEIGSVFIIDDYNNGRSPGTNLAVEEFIKSNKNYIALDTPVQQCILIRVK
jgi:Macrocin-O-methyltransferase (TylF)